jgi:hypothetical protein
LCTIGPQRTRSAAHDARAAFPTLLARALGRPRARPPARALAQVINLARGLIALEHPMSDTDEAAITASAIAGTR